jgi:hypothetical protein
MAKLEKADYGRAIALNLYVKEDELSILITALECLKGDGMIKTQAREVDDLLDDLQIIQRELRWGPHASLSD